MEYILQLLELKYLLLITFGVLIGIIIGALPGLTPTMGVALFIPFTFSLPALDGIILLGGIYSGSVFGGSIPAILFNIPGAPASVATTFDGYPLAQKGKAKKALEIATISSTIGGLFGMFILLFFAPIFAEFSLQFGPTENFWIALFGITVIAAISEGAISKNLLGGAIGILISLIGISSFTGVARFTFGQESLVGGLHVVAVLIGLFAFPQALRLIEDLANPQAKHTSLYKNQTGKIRTSVSDVFKNPKPLTLGSIIGAVIGVLPGAGGNVASIIAYNETKRLSKNKEEFGKGNIEGIIASESANNAMVGGSLIPLLTLGIPGSPTAAIFLGGLLIHGIWPGRNLFVDNAGIANSFLYSMVLSQLIMLVLGLLSIKWITKLVRIPTYFMAPIIIVFSILGAYTTQNNVFDIYTMVILGILMFILQKFDFSPAPIALGFILGPIAEEGLLQGMALGTANGSATNFFIGSLWNKILIVFILFTVSYSIWQYFKKRSLQARISVTESIKPSLNPISLITYRGITWIILSIITIIGVLNVSKMDTEMGLFPRIILYISLFLIFMQIVSVMYSNRRPFSIPFRLILMMINIKHIIFIIFISLISLLTNFLGFYIQSLILMTTIPLYVYLQKNKSSLVQIATVSLAFTLIIYLIFSALIKVPLPTGIPFSYLPFF